LILAGGGAAMQGLEKYLNRNNDLKVSTLDVRAVVDFSGKIPQEKRKELASICAVAIGAALAGGEAK
jgi:Tfp pilus assembly PilM family ATPase